MKIDDMIFRIYVDIEQLEKTIQFYEHAQDVACELRFEVEELRVKGAKVGKVMILGGEQDHIPAVSDVQALYYVDSLDEFRSWFAESGAEILSDPVTNPFGRNMVVRNPDGLIAEYFEPHPQLGK